MDENEFIISNIGVKSFFFSYSLSYFGLFLRSKTQIILLQSHWLPLFILSLIQCSSTINLTNILTTLLASKIVFYVYSMFAKWKSFFFIEKLDNNQLNNWIELRRIQTILYEFDRLHLTNIEYAYLKLISVFNPSNKTGKRNFLLKCLLKKIL